MVRAVLTALDQQVMDQKTMDKLAQNKRGHFSEIHDEELASIETVVRELMGSAAPPADT